MNITERAALVLQEIDAALAMTANSRTLLPTSLRCLKTAVEGLVRAIALLRDEEDVALAMALETDLTTLCDQWEQNK